MKNLISELRNQLMLDLTADVSAGAYVFNGKLHGFALIDGKNGETIPCQREGIIEAEKAAGASLAWTKGDLIYWDNTAKKFTVTSTSNTLAGIAFKAAGDNDTVGELELKEHRA